MNENFEELKKTFNEYKGVRTIEKWNELRENAKAVCPMTVINMLDSSGFIIKWLKN